MPNRIRRVLYDNNGTVLATGAKIVGYLIGAYCPLYPDPNSPLTRRAPGETRSHWLNRLTNNLGRGYMLRQWREQRGVRGDLSRYWRALISRRNAVGEAQLDPATTTLGGITALQIEQAYNAITPGQPGTATHVVHTDQFGYIWQVQTPTIEVAPPRPRARRPRA